MYWAAGKRLDLAIDRDIEKYRRIAEEHENIKTK
jgi:hypothetical protein